MVAYVLMFANGSNRVLIASEAYTSEMRSWKTLGDQISFTGSLWEHMNGPIAPEI